MENDFELGNGDSTNTEGVGSEPTQQIAQDLTPRLKELEEKNKQLFERAKKAEEKLKEIKPLTESREEVKTFPTIDPKEIVRLTKSLNDLDEEEVAFVYRNAKNANDPQSVIEASKDAWVLDAIKTRRERVAKEKSIPDPSSAGKSQYGIDPDEAAKNPELHRKLWEESLRKQQGSSGI